MLELGLVLRKIFVDRNDMDSKMNRIIPLFLSSENKGITKNCFDEINSFLFLDYDVLYQSQVLGKILKIIELFFDTKIYQFNCFLLNPKNNNIRDFHPWKMKSVYLLLFGDSIELEFYDNRDFSIQKKTLIEGEVLYIPEYTCSSITLSVNFNSSGRSVICFFYGEYNNYKKINIKKVFNLNDEFIYEEYTDPSKNLDENFIFPDLDEIFEEIK